MKIVLNKCYGGFGLSNKAKAMLKERGGWFDQTDPNLIDVVEELGEEASTDYSNLKVVETIAEPTDWEVDEYDGFESLTYVVDGKIYHA